ncbi:hypothetical protein GCM10029992_59270 [Glycomyces albus]
MAYRYFYDCEFIEDGRVIDLVSIAVVDEHGREYYAVSTEFDPSRAIEWVRRNVLDKLPAPASSLWKDRAAIRDDLYEFLVAPVRKKTGSHPGSGSSCGPGTEPTITSCSPSSGARCRTCRGCCRA